MLFASSQLGSTHGSTRRAGHLPRSTAASDGDAALAALLGAYRRSAYFPGPSGSGGTAGDKNQGSRRMAQWKRDLRGRMGVVEGAVGVVEGAVAMVEGAVGV